MTTKEEKEAFFQLKIDFLSFIEQILDWQNPNIILILFALLMEKKRTTQDQLIELTGLSRTTISETLSLIMDDPRGIPILQTRKRGDKKKYYYCPLTFKEYIMKLFGGTLKLIELNLEFIPSLLKRITTLDKQNNAVAHVHNFMTFFYSYNHLIKVIMDNFDPIITTYFDNPEKLFNFVDFIDKGKLHLEIDKVISESPAYQQKDNIDLIKRDFIKEMTKLGQGSSSGSNKELAFAFFMLYLEIGPITQEDIIKITKSRRAAVSEALSLLVRQNFAKVVKKENNRKKYYTPTQDLMSFISVRLKLSTHKINQIDLVMNSRFIPELDALKVENSEKKVLLEFFKDTGHYYKILGRWMSDMFDFILENI
jgi:DNA-binding transcriptional regulator GbsR (MarR family)